MEQIARIVVTLGAILVLIGLVLLVLIKIGLPLGRLPGDIRIESQNLTCVIALGTSVLLSVLLTVILNIITRFLNK